MHLSKEVRKGVERIVSKLTRNDGIKEVFKGNSNPDLNQNASPARKVSPPKRARFIQGKDPIQQSEASEESINKILLAVEGDDSPPLSCHYVLSLSCQEDNSA